MKTETYCTLCVVVITYLDAEWDAKSKTFLSFLQLQSIFQLYIVGHIKLLLVWIVPLIGNLNGQHKQSMTRKIPLGFIGILTHFSARNQKYILKMHIRAMEVSIFMLCPRGFSLWFYCKRIFHLLFCRLVKAISSVQLWMLMLQHEAVLGRQECCRFLGNAQSWLAMRRWRFIIKTYQIGMHHHFRSHNTELPS